MDTGLFEALADEKRLSIVQLLADGERCVCDVSEALDISNALASHHIKRLHAAGVVHTERKGAWLHCRLESETLLALADELRDLALRGGSASVECCAPARREAARR